MGRSFLKGAVVGLVCAVLGGATVALAGSGINGVFNLGVSNSVDAKTTLTGASPGIQLQVTNTNAAGRNGLAVNSASGGYPTGSFTNTGGGAAGAFSVNSGVAPFTVNSTTKVANLNADQLDGFDVNHIMSGGGRIGQASNADVFTFQAPATQATVSLTAPSNGFVLLQGTIVAEDDFATAACNICRADVRVHDVSANLDSPVAISTLGNGVAGKFVTIPVQWVFPVSPGSHSYTLTAGQNDTSGGPAVFDNPVLTAEFIPFGHTGSATILSPDGENTVATPTQTGRDGTSRGTP